MALWKESRAKVKRGRDSDRHAFNLRDFVPRDFSRLRNPWPLLGTYFTQSYGLKLGAPMFPLDAD